MRISDWSSDVCSSDLPIPTTTSSSPSPRSAPAAPCAATRTSRATSASNPVVASTPSRPVRSRAAMRRISRRSHATTSSIDPSGAAIRRSTSASEGSARGSPRRRRVRLRLAARSATSVRACWGPPSTGPSPSGRSTRSWSRLTRTRSRSAERSTSPIRCSGAVVTRPVSRATGAAYADHVAHIRVALCQINTVVGDLDGNVERILRAYEAAAGAGSDIAVFPELAITGYPPEDLLLKPGFVSANREVLNHIASRTGRCAAVVGFVTADRDLRNAAARCANGEVGGCYHKRLLPNDAVFDEERYFAPGVLPYTLFDVAGVKVGISICEDVWSPEGSIADQSAGGAELIVIPNGSPYFQGRQAERERMVATRAEDAHCHIAYVNEVGGQDELIYDGASFVVDERGDLVARSPQLVEHVQTRALAIRPVFRTRLLDPQIGRAPCRERVGQ